MSASRWSDLGRRSLSAAVLAPSVLLCVAVGGGLYDALIVLGGAGLAAEWMGLCRAPLMAPPGLCLLGSVLLVGLAASLSAPFAALGLAALGAILCRAAGGSTLLALGALYLGLPVVALIWLRGLANGRDAVLFLLVVVWATDIGAYLIGRALRGPKLAPSISPGKTWSGAIGGLAAAILCGLLLARVLPIGPAWAALPICLFAQAGDLLESAIKRHVGVKDSGRWIPGHGGLLDRLDALLAAAPVAAFVALVGRGGV